MQKSTVETDTDVVQRIERNDRGKTGMKSPKDREKTAESDKKAIAEKEGRKRETTLG
jgi:hypothetical protein